MSRFSYLLYIDVEGDPGAMWSGLGWLDLPADDVLPVQTRFLGGGNLISLPDLQELINGIADRITAGVSGVSQEALRLAIEQAADVKGSDVYIGRVDFNADWSVKAVKWIGVLVADKLVTDRQAGDNGDATRSISISMGTDNADRNTAPMALFTQNDQRKRSTDDIFFQNVSAITAGTTRRFKLKDED